MKIAIVPARGGSKRIPKKNIKNFLGEPAIGYTIKVLQEADIFSKIYVSTDDPSEAGVQGGSDRRLELGPTAVDRLLGHHRLDLDED